MESTICNVCDANDFDVGRSEKFADCFSGRGARWHSISTCVCRSCGHVFMSPTMTEDELSGFYSEQLRESFATPRVETIGLFSAEMNTIAATPGPGAGRTALEVGCCTGYMLRHLSGHGLALEGL
jgi:hypothetical protein